MKPEEFARRYSAEGYSVMVSLDREVLVIRKDRKDIMWSYKDGIVSWSNHYIPLKDLSDIVKTLEYFEKEKKK